jgi:hypothetical protein
MKSVPPASRLCNKTAPKFTTRTSLAGEYFVDLLINEVLLVELKTVKALDDAHMPPGA